MGKITPNRCCNCDECEKIFTSEKKLHWSDCAVHNEPASPNGSCSCVSFDASKLVCGEIF